LFRRVSFLLLLALGILFLGFTLALFGYHGTARGEWGGGWQGPPIFGFVFLIIAFFVVSRLLRRTTAPLADVMEAVSRLAAGDYEARVPQRGPADVRELVRAVNSLAERLQSSEQTRRNLFADVAHELRTPLSVIRGNAEGLLDGLYPADQPHLMPIVDETLVMTRLLDDLMTLSTAEAGALSLHREPLDPGALVEDVVAAFGPAAAGAEVSLAADIAAGLPVVEVDPVRLREVLANLIANALHHTPAGGSVRVGARAEPGAGLVISVRDTGSGIAAEDLPHIFDRFRKSPQSRGAGLGLAIAKAIVQAHGGEIGAESQPGRGTAIYFTLPLA
jgi:signal transduction histidine kinase